MVQCRVTVKTKSRAPACRAVDRWGPPYHAEETGMVQVCHRVLYHHEKQLDKVVRRHNSHDRNAMRRLEFNFIKISCVIYRAHSTPSPRETLLVAQVSSSVTRN